jgi:hypothetical protein
VADISKITVNDTTYELKDEKARVKLKTEIAWEEDDPIIGENEIVAVSTGYTQSTWLYPGDIVRLKIGGSGGSNFSNLPYIMGGEVNTVENHNGIYRGKQLCGLRDLSVFIEWLYYKVSNRDFSDIYLGDYFPVAITTTLPDGTVKTETVELMIAGFNYYYNVGNTALTKPHLVLIPRVYGFATTAKMNETNTTEGGYLNSYMHTTVLPCYAASLKAAFGGHLLSHRTLLSNAINASTPSMAGAGLTGASSGWGWTTVELQLMNEAQVYGTTVWSSSAYDVGVDNRQLPVFKFINPIQYGRGSFWLRSVVSSTNFADCYGDGLANSYGASVALPVRPLILFG